MASTYVNDLRLNEMGTGDESGSWGNVTNTNLRLIGEGLSFTTKDCFASDGDQTETVADGATDKVRGMYLKVTSSATLSTTRVLTIAPNDMSRMQYIENATTGSQIITIKQGSGATVNIASGQVKAVYLDGAGSGAAVVDAFANLSVPTAGDGTNTTQVATTAFVTTAVGNAEPFPSGTSMLFQQTAAPTGWTKQTTHNDKALRLQTGTVGTGGSVAFSTAFATPAGSVSGAPGSNLAVGAGNLAVSMSGNISDTSISTAQLPSHAHAFSRGQGNFNFGSAPNGTAGFQNGGNPSGVTSTGATGSGSGHNHAHNLSGSMTGAPELTGSVTAGNLAVASTINVQYVDFIIANKD